MNDERKLQRVTHVCAHSAQGIFKRIDENRQLLELLKQEVPELFEMDRCPWVECWIAGQDIFLNDIANAMNLEPCPSIKPYLKKWTGEKDVKNYYMEF